MSKLIDMKKIIFNYCKDKFTIFESDSPLEEAFGLHINFKSDDWKKFIEITQNLNINILYYYQDNNVDSHPNEIGFIQLGFIYNEVMHVYSKSEDWYTKLVYDEDNEDQDYTNENSIIVDKEEIIKLSKTSVTKILDKILDFSEKTGKDISLYNVSSLLDDYLLYNYGFRYNYIKDDIAFFKSINLKLDEIKEFRDEMEEVIKLLEEKRGELERKKLEEDLTNDDEILKTLIHECVEWARSNALPRLNKSNVYRFCVLKNSKLSDTGIDKLYIMANKELKKRSQE